MRFPDSSRGVACSLASSLLLGMVFIFSRLVQRTMSLRPFLFWWFAAALLWLPVIMALRGMGWRRFGRVLLRHWPFFLAYNVIEGVGNVFFFYLIRSIDPTVVAFFNSLSPFVGAVIAFLYLGERLGGRELLGGLASVVGVVAITYVAPDIGLRHVLYASAMTVLYSFNNVLVKKVVADVPPLLITAGRIICLATGFSLALLVGGGFRLPTAAEGGWILIGTLSGPVLGMFFLFASLEYLPATTVFLLRNVQPFLVAGAAALFLGQPFTLQKLAGGSLVVAGLTFMLLSRRRSGEGFLA